MHRILLSSLFEKLVLPQSQIHHFYCKNLKVFNLNTIFMSLSLGWVNIDIFFSLKKYPSLFFFSYSCIWKSTILMYSHVDFSKKKKKTCSPILSNPKRAKSIEGNESFLAAILFIYFFKVKIFHMPMPLYWGPSIRDPRCPWINNPPLIQWL